MSENAAAGHVCHCRSTARRVALSLGGTEANLKDFDAVVSRFGGTWHKALSVLELPVGSRCTFPSVPALRDFVLTQWSAYADVFRCCFLEPDVPVEQQLANIVSAEPFKVWSRDRDTPLQDILEHRRIATWFQPVFAGPELSIWGWECLVRGIGSDGEVIQPKDFFDWAYSESLVFMLDRLCRERHIENCARADTPAHTKFLINFLPTVIYDPAVCLASTFDIAQREGLDPRRVVFEVVESELVTDREHLRRILDQYRAAGFNVALDDVGAGHAGLSLLGDLSPDLIKIDRELVSKATDSKLHRTICRSIVDIARSTDKMVLAEGVETEAEYALFRDLGADLFQGYLFGKPQPEPVLTSAYQPAVAGPKAVAGG